MTDISESGIEAVKAVIGAARDLLDISGRSRNVSAERNELQQALHDLELCEDPAIEALIPTKPEAGESETQRLREALEEIANFKPKSFDFAAPTEVATFCQDRARSALQSKKPE